MLTKDETRDLDAFVAHWREELLKQLGDTDQQKIVDEINTHIIATLNRRAAEVTKAILGVEEKWGKIEVDHCNGRSGQSVIGKAIEVAAIPIIEKWAVETVTHMLKDDGKIAKKVRKDIREAMFKELRTRVLNRVHEKMYALRNEESQRIAGAIVDKMKRRIAAKIADPDVRDAVLGTVDGRG